MEKRTVDILGSEWTILFGTETQFPALKGVDGYTDTSIHCIVIDVMDHADEDSAKKDLDSYKKLVLRHELIHAFLFESGLDGNTANVGNWAINEEMVDWFAIQLPKIIDTCRKALAL